MRRHEPPRLSGAGIPPCEAQRGRTKAPGHRATEGEAMVQVTTQLRQLPNESLTLAELKQLILKGAEDLDGSTAAHTNFRVLVEAVLWFAHGRGAAAVVRHGVRP